MHWRRRPRYRNTATRLISDEASRPLRVTLMRRGRDTEHLPSWVGEALRIVLLMLAKAARGTSRINPATGRRRYLTDVERVSSADQIASFCLITYSRTRFGSGWLKSMPIASGLLHATHPGTSAKRGMATWTNVPTVTARRVSILQPSDVQSVIRTGCVSNLSAATVAAQSTGMRTALRSSSASHDGYSGFGDLFAITPGVADRSQYLVTNPR